MKRTRAAFETAATAILVVAAVGMVGLNLHDRVTGGKSSIRRDVRIVPTWQEDNRAGIWSGPEQARVVITEFMDLQCPFCARLAPRMDSVLSEFNDVAVVFHHFPLDTHTQAVPAAIALECGDRQRLFTPMYRKLLAEQHLFGIKHWREFGVEAGVRDIGSFVQCLSLPVDSFPRIGLGRELGGRAGVSSTPTLWVNGQVVPVPDLEGIRAAIRSATKESG